MKILSQLNICWLIMITWPAFSQGYEISITFNSRNDTVILGHYFARADMLIPDDTLILDKKKAGVFKGDQKLEKGLYFIYSGNQRLDIIIGDHQKFKVVIDTVDIIRRTKFTSSAENEVFYNFQRYNNDLGKDFQQLASQLENADTDAAKNIREKMQQLTKNRLEYIRKEIADHPGLYTGKFLNTLVPIDTQLPDYPRDEQGNITDSSFLYHWYRAHFFDNFDIFSPDMLRTPFYEDKLLEYMTRVIPQHPDSICTEADKIIMKAKGNEDVFRCILVTLFNHYVKSNIMVHENVWVHMAEKWYIPDAGWSTGDYIEKLEAEVKKKKSNLIGLSAPPMEMLMYLPPEHFKAAVLDTSIKYDMYAGVDIPDFRKNLKNRYTVIFFFDLACNHCKRTVQEMSKVYENVKDKGLEVVAVQTVITKEAKGQWIDYMNDHHLLQWFNVWSPFSNRYRDFYDVSMTPLIYLLDENQTIIGKRLAPEQVQEIILAN